MNQYKTYPQYKDSGVEWLGKIPEHWTTPKLKLFIVTTKGFAFKSNDFTEDGIPVVKMSEIKNGTINKSSVFLPERFKQSHRQVMLAYQDIVVSTVGSSAEVKNSAVGQIGVVPKMHNESLLNQNTVIFSPNRKLLSNSYLPYVLKSQAYREHLDLHAHGTANQASLNLEDMLKFVFSLPPLPEQQTIANYLDKATAKIDTLIKKQTKLIALLKEKRQAVISTAVSRGLDRSVPMKDSGVEWLGEIPEGWDVSKLRFIFSFSKGLTITKANLVDEGIPCVNYGEIHSKYGFEVSADKHELKCVDDSYLGTSKASLLSKGDFVFADTSEDIDGAGNFTHVSSNTPIFAGYHTIIARQVGEHNFRFLAYLIDSVAFRRQIRLAVKGVKVFSITQYILRASTVWLPKIDEQKEIAKYLDETTSKIDNLISKATKAIDLLKERRTALISAVVTGKIDVRGEV